MLLIYRLGATGCEACRSLDL